MIKAILAIIFKNQVATKVTGGIAGGGGLIALIFALHGDIKAEINMGDTRVRQYVDLKVESIDTKIQGMSKGQEEIKDLLKTIDKRLYDLKSNK